MPSKSIHVTKAQGNEGFALSISLDSQPRIDWALVALFYAAIHYVEAYLAVTDVHLRSHIHRDNVVGRDPNLRKIFREYQELKFFGYASRYEPAQFTAETFTTQALPQFSTLKGYILTLL